MWWRLQQTGTYINLARVQTVRMTNEGRTIAFEYAGAIEVLDTYQDDKDAAKAFEILSNKLMTGR